MTRGIAPRPAALFVRGQAPMRAYYRLTDGTRRFEAWVRRARGRLVDGDAVAERYGYLIDWLGELQPDVRYTVAPP